MAGVPAVTQARRQPREIAAMYREGLTVAEMAQHLGLPYHAVRTAAFEMGFVGARGATPSPRRAARFAKVIAARKGRQEARAARWAKVVAMREDKLTYQEIGGHFGITGERVRQILRQAGRRDLCRADLIKPFIEKTCPVCRCAFGHSKRFGEKQTPNAGVNVHCSRECASAHQARTPTAHQRKIAEIVLRARAEKKTWDEAAQEAGLNNKARATTAQHYAKMWRDKTGADVSWAFPGRGSAHRSKHPSLAAPPNFFNVFDHPRRDISDVLESHAATLQAPGG